MLWYDSLKSCYIVISFISNTCKINGLSCTIRNNKLNLQLSLQLVAVGLIAEGAALRYDAVFSHKQIDLIFSAMSMVHQSFSTNLLIWRWLMVVSGIFLVLGSFSTMLLIRRKSKFLHLLVSTYWFGWLKSCLNQLNN